MNTPGFNKIIHLDEYFSTGESTVQPVMLWANGRPCYEGITKHASVGSEYFKTITPIPGHSFVYLLALGAWEHYGENRNGDSFPEYPYMETAIPPWIAPKDTIVNHYLSFELYGKNYRHHINKDPRKAVGDVHKAFWNPSMHRVELLVNLDNAKAPDLADRIAAGEFPPVSMGTRVSYDVCSICGNRAPTRKQYCNHLLQQMRDVINGKKVCALNPSPKFFDISWVIKPADQTAFMMQKVAGDSPYELLSGARAGEYLEKVSQSKAAAQKMAVIDKIVQGFPVDAKVEGFNSTEIENASKMRNLVLDAGSNTPDFDDASLREMADKFTLPGIASTFMASGMMQLSTPEMTKIILFKSFPNAEVSDSLVDKMVAANQGVFKLLGDFPNILDNLQETGALDMGVEHINPELLERLKPCIEKRAGIGEYLTRRFIPAKYREEVPYSTPLSITDPASGTQYRTTRGAAVRAHDEIAKRNLYKVIGGGALLGGAYKLMGTGLAHRGLGKLKPLVGVGLGALGLSQMPSMGKHYMTDQGVPVPTLTELSKYSAAGGMASLGIPILGTLGAMTALSHDYQSRMNSGMPLGYSGLPLSRRLLDRVGQFSHDHPVLTAAGSAAALRGLGRSSAVQSALQKVRPVGSKVKQEVFNAREALRDISEGIKQSSYIENFVVPSHSTVILPSIDMEKISEWLGWAIYES